MRRIVVLSVLGLIVLVLILAQLFLPGIAARQLRDRLKGNGTVLQVSVSAFPAIELLWHQADKVVIRMGEYRSSSGHLGSLLDQAGDVGTLNASAGVLTAGLLTLRDATLTKRGDELLGSARVTEDDLRSAVPFLDSVTPVASQDGRLVLRGTATVLGVSATIDATVAAVNGALIVQPDVPLGALATVTVFSDPHVAVQSVGASPTSTGFSVSAEARLH